MRIRKNTPKRTWHIKHFRRNLFFTADVKAWLFDWLVAYWFLNIHICICHTYPGREQLNNKSTSHDRFCQVNWLRWRVDNLISTRKWCLICIIILPCNSLHKDLVRIFNKQQVWHSPYTRPDLTHFRPDRLLHILYISHSQTLGTRKFKKHDVWDYYVCIIVPDDV